MNIISDSRKYAILPTILSMLLCATAVHAEPDAEYVGASKCKLCHNKLGEGQQYNVWKKMTHAQAFKVLLSERAIAVGKERGLEKPPSESMECLQCHVTGYDVETQSHPPKIKPDYGIQCETCHGPGSNHLDDGKLAMMKKEVDISSHILRADESTCLGCHNDRNPTWNPEKYTRESGEKVGFDFEQAYAIIDHSNPKKAK